MFVYECEYKGNFIFVKPQFNYLFYSKIVKVKFYRLNLVVSLDKQL